MNAFRNRSAYVIAPLMILFCAVVSLADTNGDPGEQREIKITARRFEFVPKKITLRKGERVRLVITSEDVDHGFAIRELDVDVPVKAKQTKTVELTADKEGKFDIICSVFCGDGHPDMVGELVVTGEQPASDTGMNVVFDETNPSVVYVESNGERIRIDTRAKTYARVTEPPAGEPKRAEPPAPTKERESSKAYEPYDYHIVNLPTPKRVRRHSLNVYFTHRFAQPIDPIKESDDDLFGLDSFSASSLGFTYGITDSLYVNIYRSPLCQPGLCKTVELGLGYHLLDEAGRSPVALSTYASIEGDNNFKRNFTYNLQAMVGRSVTKYVNLFFSPAVHLKSNGQSRFNPSSEFFGPIADQFRLGTHTGSFGFGVNASFTRTASFLFEYTPRVGFKMGRVIPIIEASPTGVRVTGFRNESEAEIGFGIEKRIGRHVFSLTFSNTQTTTTARYNSSNNALSPSKVSIGFNLFRRLL